MAGKVGDGIGGTVRIDRAGISVARRQRVGQGGPMASQIFVGHRDLEITGTDMASVRR